MYKFLNMYSMDDAAAQKENWPRLPSIIIYQNLITFQKLIQYINF